MQISSSSAVATNAIAESQNAASLVTKNINYSPTIGGKTYAADINLSAGEYIATVPTLAPPVTASGSTLLVAENNLSARLNLVV